MVLVIEIFYEIVSSLGVYLVLFIVLMMTINVSYCVSCWEYYD